jgi:hypothetical protein
MRCVGEAMHLFPKRCVGEAREGTKSIWLNTSFVVVVVVVVVVVAFGRVRAYNCCFKSRMQCNISGNFSRTESLGGGGDRRLVLYTASKALRVTAAVYRWQLEHAARR